MLRKEKHLAGNYYLLEEEGRNGFSIRYKLRNGDFVGRVPCCVIEYGIGDSLIISKIDGQNGVEYYSLNMKNDRDIGKTEEFLKGPLSLSQLSSLRYKDYKLIKVPKR